MQGHVIRVHCIELWETLALRATSGSPNCRCGEIFLLNHKLIFNPVINSIYIRLLEFESFIVLKYHISISCSSYF